MDFNIVKRQIITEYLRLYRSERDGDTWSLETVLNVFRYYYASYKQHFKVDHPILSSDSISNIIIGLPSFSSDEGFTLDIVPDDYPVLIEAYFNQRFSNCNYSMAHFMSGNIRLLRYYENLY